MMSVPQVPPVGLEGAKSEIVGKQSIQSSITNQTMGWGGVGCGGDDELWEKNQINKQKYRVASNWPPIGFHSFFFSCSAVASLSRSISRR